MTSAAQVIRTIPRGPRGLIGRPPIPMWTNDYFLSFVDDDGNQIGPAPKNLIGPQGPSGSAQFFRNLPQVAASVVGSAIDSIVVARRASGLPFVPTNYVRSAVEPLHTGKVRSADRFLPDGSTDLVNGGWWTIVEAVVDIRMLGAVSGAIIDAEMTAAIAVASAIGSALGIPNGFYRFLKQVNLSPMLGSSIILSGAIRFDFTSATDAADFPGGGFVYMDGGPLVQLPDLAANVSQGSAALTFKTNPNLASADRICMFNPQAGSYSALQPYYFAGEFSSISDGSGGANVKLYGATIAGYNAAEVYVYKHPNKRISVTGGTITIMESRAAGFSETAGIKADRVVDSDLSAFRPTQSLYAGMALKQCIGLFGTGYQCKMVFPAGGGTCYGLIYGNCQDLNIEGEFNGGRHGAAGGGYGDVGSVPSSRVHIRGTFRNSPDALSSLGAVNFHGNCRDCTYEGVMEGGVTMAGANNRILKGIISARPSQNGLAIYFGEMVSTKFKIEGRITVPAATVGTPVISIGDLGSSPLNALVQFGGTLDLSGIEFDCPYNSRLITVQNHAANPAEPIILDVRGAKWLRSATAPTNSIIVNAIGARGIELALMEGFVNGPNAPYSMTGAAKVRGWRVTSGIALAPSTAASVVTGTRAINAPKVPYISFDAPVTMGGARAYPFTDRPNTSTTQVSIGMATNDGNSFPSTAGGTLGFTAVLDEY